MKMCVPTPTLRMAGRAERLASVDVVQGNLRNCEEQCRKARKTRTWYANARTASSAYPCPNSSSQFAVPAVPSGRLQTHCEGKSETLTETWRVVQQQLSSEPFRLTVPALSLPPPRRVSALPSARPSKNRRPLKLKTYHVFA